MEIGLNLTVNVAARTWTIVKLGLDETHLAFPTLEFNFFPFSLLAIFQYMLEIIRS